MAENLRLSSKSHWDVPIDVNGKTIHILASHPTPGFDGPEDRNGKRNSDELRFWYDYIRNQQADYIYDDKGKRGGLEGQRFVLAGDLNASSVEGIGDRVMANTLLTLEQLNDDTIPSSAGGQQNRR